MTLSDPLNHLGSIWYPFSPNQYLDRDFFATSYSKAALAAYYSHLFNKRGAWNKRGGGAKVAKSLNVELGINEEGGIFGKN